MALEVLTPAGLSGLALDEATDIISAITELQGLRFSVVTGAGAATPIALTGILTTDTIVAAIMSAAGVLSNRVDFSIPSNGNVQFAGATSGNTVLVVWFNKDNA